MPSTNPLQPVMEHGWICGFRNMVRKENSLWWSTRKWWVQSLVWLFILNGFIALILWIIPALDKSPSVPAATELLQVFVTTLEGGFAMIGVMVLAQGLVVNEKKFGTAAWIMSNPVSRSSFILSKLVGNGWGIFIIVVLLQSLVCYFQLSLKAHFLPNPVPFILGIALVCLHMLFYLTLGIMLGTLFNSTGPVVGISIGLFIGLTILSQVLAGIAPWLAGILPDRITQLAGIVTAGQALPAAWPIPVSIAVILSVIFILIAIFRFGREEF